MKEKKDQAKVVRDPEAIAIDRMTRILNELEPEAIDRLLDFLYSKYTDEASRPRTEGAVAGGVS